MAIKKVQRTDVGGLRRPSMTPQGFLRVEGYSAKVGTQEYPNADGSRRIELRLPEEVFDSKSLASYEGASFTNDHPSSMVTPSNVKRLEMGSVVNAHRDGEHVATPIIVKDADMISRVKRGDKVQLSVGYTVDLDETPGVHPVYGKYDAIQRNIVVNHVALVDRARAGETARLRLDGAMIVTTVDLVTTSVAGHQHTIDADCPTTSWAIADGSDMGHSHDVVRGPDGTLTILENAGHTHTIAVTAPTTNLDRRNLMDPNKLNETIAELNKQLAAAEQREGAATSRADAATTRADVAEGRIATMQIEITELRTRADSASSATITAAVEVERTRADTAIAALDRMTKDQPKLVRERAALENVAVGILGTEVRLDDLNTRQIHVEVVKRLDATADVTDAVASGTIEGRFLALVEQRKRSVRTLARASEILAERNDAVEVVDANGADDLEAARHAYRTQWQKPLPNSRHNLTKQGA